MLLCLISVLVLLFLLVSKTLVSRLQTAGSKVLGQKFHSCSLAILYPLHENNLHENERRRFYQGLNRGEKK
jgi:hypothetical protein